MSQTVMRRLTADQYRRSIRDIFGAQVNVAGRFEPELRQDGLLAVGSSRVSVTSAGMEQYDALARNIAAQVLSEQQRIAFMPCTPRAADKVDDACAREFIQRVGRLLFRRPLSDGELKTQAAVAAAATKSLSDFYAGLELSLANLLVAPQFLFRVEAVDPATQQLDAYSKATRLSFLLWNTTPDDELLTAAARGELDSAAGVERHAQRMMHSPRLHDGVRAFFSDMLAFDGFESLEKDTALFPLFSSKLAADAQEQSLKLIVDHLITRDQDYRDLFTTRKTFLTQNLALIYKLPVADRDGWTAYEFPEGDTHQGLLTQLGFLQLHSQPGRSSPTLRGKAVRELLMCQKVPDPPGNVDFSAVVNENDPVNRTVRQRLTAHSTDPSCSGCHRVMDPMGLALENFDSLGQYRAAEQGVPIDTSGELDRVKYEDAVGMSRALHDHPRVPKCLVQRLVGYATGRTPAKTETPALNALETEFAQAQYSVPRLLLQLATSELFQSNPVQSNPAPAASAPQAAVAKRREIATLESDT